MTYPVLERLLGLLNPVSIMRLMKVCRIVREAVLRYSQNRQWSINTHLERFVDDPLLFRSQLGKCCGIVSGSNALQFFDGVDYPESDMDIYFDSSKRLA